ncbi:hypothetical protein C8R45DRAFT_933714 [Mycena sanguinolenta]|nr:hypothetical protein C8R45DRAFT_933714 [Mycena sanguinolenta]
MSAFRTAPLGKARSARISLKIFQELITALQSLYHRRQFFRSTAVKVRQFNIFVTQSTWPFHATAVTRLLCSRPPHKHHVPTTHRSIASAMLTDLIVSPRAALNAGVGGKGVVLMAPSVSETDPAFSKWLARISDPMTNSLRHRGPLSLYRCIQSPAPLPPSTFNASEMSRFFHIPSSAIGSSPGASESYPHCEPSVDLRMYELSGNVVTAMG